MFNTRHLLLLCLTLTGSSLFAQHRCASAENLAQQLEADPAIAERRADIENHTHAFEANSSAELRSSVITIPVVFHVIYNGASENVPDATLLSQIDVLNEDFRMLNEDAGSVDAAFTSIQADAQVEFCLAIVDPAGNPTTGINRKSSTVTSWDYILGEMKFDVSGGIDIWDRDEYLNIWVCDISSGILGYAQFPGGSASSDGVVIDYAYVGTTAWSSGPQSPYNLGRTGTHEVGHWLNLYHIWGDGGCGVDDSVSDTPMSDGPNFGCPGTTTNCSSQDNTQNYMDYTDDACMVMFSAGQATRMQSAFSSGGAREALANSEACGGTAIATCDSTTAPDNLTAFIDEPNKKVVLNWNAVDQSILSQVVISKDGGSTFEKINIYETSASSFTIPRGSFDGDLDIEHGWKVRAACAMDIGSKTPWSEPSFFIINFRGHGVERIGFSAENIYPNPASNFLNVSIMSDLEKETTLRVMDLTGRLLTSKTLRLTTGSNTIQLNTSGIESGIYLLDVGGTYHRFQIAQ